MTTIYTLYAKPGQNFRCSSGASYVADPTGAVAGVEQPDLGDMLAAGALPSPTAVGAVGSKEIAGVAYILEATDAGLVLVFTNAGAIALTVPAGLPVNFQCCVIQSGAGAVTFTGSGATVVNRQSHTATAGQYALVSLIAIAQDSLVLGGDTA